ncbi:hypothetical protein TSOC_002617 [Tetrabaena socialis]|uniref:Uncharacterized protein n=1 Tax=Tetrabaena socialis TaxID=47790 RepID=A0A2J8ADP5_9CHLO|nr:hypothetical protein TSOC_002617 [Tetrabaena socialis]|eukprot:PNH10635.1 hypothetical protein TSOC_002617 [Tetrabaena socialis]
MGDKIWSFMETWFSALMSRDACLPKWATDSTVVASLEAKSPSNVESTSRFLTPIFTDLFGDCSNINGFKTLLTSCIGFTSDDTCESSSGDGNSSSRCAWKFYGTVFTKEYCDARDSMIINSLVVQTDAGEWRMQQKDLIDSLQPVPHNYRRYQQERGECCTTPLVCCRHWYHVEPTAGYQQQQQSGYDQPAAGYHQSGCHQSGYHQQQSLAHHWYQWY